MANIKKIPNWRFETADLEQQHRFEAWADSVSGYGDHTEVTNSKLSPSWESEFWVVDSMVLTENILGAFQATRGPKIIRQADFEHILVRLVLSGSQNAIFGELSTKMRPGEVHIFDLNSPYYAETPEHLSSLVAILPYKSVGYDPDRHPDHMCFPVDSLVCRMVSDALILLRDKVSSMEPDEAEFLARGVSGLIRGIISPSDHDFEATAQTDHARLTILKQYIEQNLRNPNLDISNICKTFNASRAKVYRLFAADKGVVSYVSERRLVHAFKKINRAAPQRGKIKQIAEQYGFIDQGHFSRLFKKKFKISPSEAMGLWTDDEFNNRELKIDNTPNKLVSFRR